MIRKSETVKEEEKEKEILMRSAGVYKALVNLEQSFAQATHKIDLSSQKLIVASHF